QGCQAEQKLFTECLFSDQSKALIHIFFGEREVAKIPDIPKETPVTAVNRVAVVGSGTMGGGITMVFANAGIPVLLKDVDEAALNLGMVVEAVFEGMALKKSVFADLDRACKPGAILASNTSTLNIDEIAAATSR